LIENALKVELGNRRELKSSGYLKYFPEEGTGLPQGGLLSPLFANVFLYPLDRAMMDRGFNMVRYADDILVSCRDRQEAEEAHALCKSVLEDKLGLTVRNVDSESPKASRIEPFSNQQFLGIQFRADRLSPWKTKVYPEPSAFKNNISELRSIQLEPPHPDLIRNLQHLKSKVNSWGAAYYFTDIQQSSYDGINNHLLATVESIMARFGFVPDRSGLSISTLNKIGILTYSQRLTQIKDKRKQAQLRAQKGTKRPDPAIRERVVS